MPHSDTEERRRYMRSYMVENAERMAAYKKEWRSKNEPATRRHMLKSCYGLTPEQYDAMEEAQGYVCAICRQPERVLHPRTRKPWRLAVDHDHTTGRVRALLCAACNRGLGLFGDSAERLRAAATYLDTKNIPGL